MTSYWWIYCSQTPLPSIWLRPFWTIFKRDSLKPGIQCQVVPCQVVPRNSSPRKPPKAFQPAKCKGLPFVASDNWKPRKGSKLDANRYIAPSRKWGRRREKDTSFYMVSLYIHIFLFIVFIYLFTYVLIYWFMCIYVHVYVFNSCIYLCYI